MSHFEDEYLAKALADAEKLKAATADALAARQEANRLEDAELALSDPTPPPSGMSDAEWDRLLAEGAIPEGSSDPNGPRGPVDDPPATVTTDTNTDTATPVTDDGGTGGGTTTGGGGGGTTGGGGGGTIVSDEPEADAYPGMMGGGTLIEITRANGDNMFMQAYEYPPGSGDFIAWQFESWDQVLQTFGGTPVAQQVGEDKRGLYTIVGDSSVVSGFDSDFSTVVSETILEATQGVSPGLAEKMLEDPEMMAIIVQGTLGEWDPDRIRAEQRRTTYWKDTLYPGIESFYNLTVEPERAWLDYSRNVEGNLISLGYERDLDGSFRSTLGSMLNSGIDDETFNTLSPTFLRAESSTGFYDSLNQWAVQDLGKELDFDSWFSLMEGTAEQELTLLAERATFQFVVDNAGSDIAADQIAQITSNFDYSEGQLGTIVEDFDATMTALAGRALGKYDLTADDVLALKAGSDAASGRSHEDIRVKSLQAAREEGLADDRKAKLFTDYIGSRGTPIKPGLSSANPLS